MLLRALGRNFYYWGRTSVAIWPNLTANDEIVHDRQRTQIVKDIRFDFQYGRYTMFLWNRRAYVYQSDLQFVVVKHEFSMSARKRNRIILCEMPLPTICDDNDTFDPSLMGFMRSLFKNTFVHGKKFDNRGVRLDAIWLIPTDPPHILFYKRIYFVYILLTQGWIIEPDNLNTIRGNCQQCGSPDVTLKCSEASCNVLYCSQECASTH
jgi:hypothetical protein